MGYTLTQAERIFKSQGYICTVLTNKGLKNIESKIPEYLFKKANIVAIPNDKLHIIQGEPQ